MGREKLSGLPRSRKARRRGQEVDVNRKGLVIGRGRRGGPLAPPKSKAGLTLIKPAFVYLSGYTEAVTLLAARPFGP